MIILISIFIIGAASHSANTTAGEKHPHKTQKAYLVQTKLTQKELETVIKGGEVQMVSLKKRKNFKKTKKSAENSPNGITKVNAIEKDNINSNNDNTSESSEESVQEIDEDDLFREIEDEIKKESLNPIDEFHVKEATEGVQGTTTFVAKTKGKFMDSLYEKKFGKIYGYLTLIFCISALIYVFNLKKKDKVEYKRLHFENYYDIDLSKDYMITKGD